MAKILIVEDEWLLAEYYRAVVEVLGYEVCDVAVSAEDAVEAAHKNTPDLILMDVQLRGEKDGVDAALEIHEMRPTPTIYVTASRDPLTMGRIETDHAAEVLLKPVVERDLRRSLARHCPLE